MRFLRDTGILFWYNVRVTLRNPVWVLMGIFQPVLYLLLFAPLLDALSNAPGFPAGGGLAVFTPAAMVMIGLFGAVFGGYGLIAQLRAGEIERLRVTPTSRLALLMGSVLRDVVQVLVQAVLMVVIALLLGLDLKNVAGVGIALAMLGLMGLLLASCSHALALTLKDENSFSSTFQFFLLPLMLLSGILLPLSLAPDWLRTIAAFNPLAYVMDAVRALFAGRLGDVAVLQGFFVLIPLTALALWWAVRSYRKAIC
jgi:ABC-2 type transport system permease protein